MIKIIDKEKNLSFVIDISESLCNAIRRAILEIPTLAIDEVEIFKNDSALYDEVIANRLGLIPLKTEKLIEREKCSCKGKGCSRCSVDLKLVAKGPGTVYAKNLKGKAKPVYEEIPIVDLIEGQEIEMVARARLGKGTEHTKFSPGIIYYRNVAEIEVSKDCNLCKKCVEACPQKILSGDKKIILKDIYKCDLCEACVETCKKHGKNAVKIKPGREIVFFIESFGQKSEKEMFLQALQALRENLKELKKVK